MPNDNPTPTTDRAGHVCSTAELSPIAYLYHDASTPIDAHPWLHSTMLVLAADRQPGLRGETPLVTLEQAMAMVAAEREACAKTCEEVATWAGTTWRNAGLDCAAWIRKRLNARNQAGPEAQP